jgi:hypothetical protein
MIISGYMGQSAPPAPGTAARLPFSRPSAASPNLQPRIPRTEFFTHLQPFRSVLPPNQAFRTRGINVAASGWRRGGPVPDALGQPAVQQDQPQGPNGNGMPGARYGSVPIGPGAFRAVMRTGVWGPWFSQGEPSIHSGVRRVPNAVRGGHNAAYPVDRYAGTYRRGSL